MGTNAPLPVWLRNYLVATRQEAWNDPRENRAFADLLHSILDPLRVPGGDYLDVVVLRSTSFATERMRRGSQQHIVFDLSLMEVFEHLSRLTLSGMSVRQMLAPLNPLFANRLASRGLLGATAVAIRGSWIKGARLPATSDVEDDFFHSNAYLQGLFAFLHEVGHVARSASETLIRAERLLTLEVWADALSPYREMPEGERPSASAHWLDSLPEAAQGALPNDVLINLAEWHREKVAVRNRDLICNWPIVEIIDRILDDPSSAIAEEVLCDAQALWTLAEVHSPGTTLADRVTAAIMAGQNLHLLRRLEHDGARGMPDAVAASDSLVRNRLLTLFGQSLLSINAGVLEEDDGVARDAAVEETLSLHDTLHNRVDLLATAVDLWPWVNIVTLEASLEANEFASDLPTIAEDATELLRPRGRFSLGEPDVDVGPGHDPKSVSGGLAKIVAGRMPAGTDSAVSTTTISLADLAGADYEQLRSEIARHMLERLGIVDRPVAALAATAVSGAIGGLARSPEIRPFALASIRGRTQLDFFHPIEEGSTPELLELLAQRLTSRASVIEVAAITCRGNAAWNRPDAVITQVGRPGKPDVPWLAIIAEYSTSALFRGPRCNELSLVLVDPIVRSPTRRP